MKLLMIIKTLKTKSKTKKKNIFKLESLKHQENVNKEKNEILNFNKNIKNLNDFKQKINDDKNKPTKFYSNSVENSFQKSFKDNIIIINEFDENLIGKNERKNNFDRNFHAKNKRKSRFKRTTKKNGQHSQKKNPKCSNNKTNQQK